MEEDEYIWESRRFWRRLLIWILGPVALITLFYAEENWRGRHAWSKFRQETEAKGGVLDWKAYIPPEVSPDDNLFAAPNMSQWFMGRGYTALSARLNYGSLSNASYQLIMTNGGRVLLAEIKVATKWVSAQVGDAKVFHAADPGCKAQVDEWTQNLVGTNFIGAMGFCFVAHSLQQIQPGHAVMQNDGPITAAQLTALFPTNPVSAFSPVVAAKERGGVTIEDAGNSSYRVWLQPPPHYTVHEYLEWSDGLQPEFDAIREAVQRPCTRMNGNYEDPISLPIPNFVTLRYLAQVLCVRAQCELVQGRPEDALKDLTLVRNLERIMIPRPTARPVTLVAAMINVAITGLYVQTVADGFRFHAWREPQIAALQEQLREINLFPPLAESLQTERASICHTMETVPIKDIKTRLITGTGGPPKTMTPIENFQMLRYSFIPSGWVYQNMVMAGTLLQRTIDSFGLSTGVVTPAAGMRASEEIVSKFSQLSPNSFLAADFIPNYYRAVQTAANAQAKATQGYLACGLERYRAIHGSYPATLAELTPEFAKEIPHDIIGGAPLKYRRTNDNEYLLYSIGWNEKDDGGTVMLTLGGTPSPDLAKGDWVWPPPPLR